MKQLKLINFLLFSLNNKFYYPYLFKGDLSFSNVLERFRFSLDNITKMECNYNSATDKPISFIKANSKVFNLSLKEDKVQSQIKLYNLILNEIKEEIPYRVSIIVNNNILIIEDRVIDFGSIYICNILVDYKSFINKMHYHL